MIRHCHSEILSGECINTGYYGSKTMKDEEQVVRMDILECFGDRYSVAKVNHWQQEGQIAPECR